MKYLNSKKQFTENKTINKNFVKVNEDVENSGPFANDIPWGDSLLGRLINSTIRKAKIGANLLRMDNVVKRLQDAMDELLITSKANTLEDEDKEQLQKSLLFSFLYNLEQAALNMEEQEITLVELKNLTISTIEEVNKREISDKEGLLGLLEEWKKFLDTLKEDEETKPEEIKPEVTSNYNAYLENFKSVLRLCKLYEEYQKTKVRPTTQTSKDVKSGQLTTEPSTVKKESLLFESNGVSVEMPLKSLYTLVKGTSQISDIDGFLKLDLKNQSLDKFKNSITKIYNIIRKKAGINESIDNLLTRPEGLADKIFALYQVTKTNELGKFANLSQGLQSEIVTFNKTMKSCFVIPKKESIFTKYSEFLKRITEAEEVDNSEETNTGEGEVSSPKNPPRLPERVKDYWQKKMDLQKWMMEKTEFSKVKVNLDKKLEEKKDSLIINGLDPVIEIVKIFNRAYKLHTTQVIPTGRKGGRVSNKTFMEYTCFGSGSPDNAGSGGGPYRNNAIFNKWEDAVQNILKERKYQPIFNIETRLRNGDNMIEKAGSNLRKFMTDMLDGDEFYKTGKEGQGLQAKFLDKYFGYKGDDKGLAYSESDIKQNGETSGPISENAVNLSFTKDLISYEKVEELKGSFFCCDLKVGGDQRQYYFFIQDIVGGMAYVVYSSSFYYFKRYITESGKSIKKLDKGALPFGIKLERLSGEGTEKAEEYRLKATKLKFDSLISKDGKFNLLGGYNVKYLIRFKDGKNRADYPAQGAEKPDTLLINGVYSLFVEEGDVETKSNKTRLQIKLTDDRIKTIAGFPTISRTDGIANAQITKQ